MNLAFPARLFAACVVAVSCYVSPAFGASVDFYLKIEGIPGESREPGAIDLAACTYEVKSPRDSASGLATGKRSSSGMGTGKVSVSDLSVMKRIDKSSPILMKACASGKHFSNVVLVGKKASNTGGQEQFLEVKLTDCLISSFACTGATGDTAPTEELSFDFSSSEVTFFADGKPVTGQ